MDKVFATLRTFGVLLGIWVVLAVVGIVTGVIPIEDLMGGGDGSQTATDAGVEAADGGTEEAADGGVERASTEAEPSEDEGEAGTSGDAPPAASTGDGLGTRWAVCPRSATEPSIAIGELFGGGAPEIVVGCADGWHVVGLGPAGPFRIGRFEIEEPPRDQLPRTGPAAFGDVDGDEHPDLVLPLAFRSDNGATRGGALFWVPASPFGGIREPVVLAPIAAVSAAIAPIDGAAGEDVAAINRANALAQLDSEAWAFSGGAAPARMQALPLGVEGAAVAISDLDRDRHADVIALSQGRVDLHFGDGAGGFERSHTLELEGAREIALGDLDEDGAPDLVVLGQGIRWIRAGALDGMEPRGLDGVPTQLRGLQAVDTNADEHVDLVGWDHPRLFVLRWRAEVAFDPVSGVSLVGGSFGPRRHAVADLDGDGAADDLVLLGGEAGDDAPLELLMIMDALEEAELTPPAESRPLPDAPLVLRAILRR